MRTRKPSIVGCAVSEFVYTNGILLGAFKVSNYSETACRLLSLFTVLYLHNNRQNLREFLIKFWCYIDTMIHNCE